MHVTDTIKLAAQNLLRTKGRSGLTMLGIVIGIMSVILMLSIGKAAERFLLSQIATFGSDMLIIANGSGEERNGGPNPMIKQTLTEADYKRLTSRPWVRSIDALVIRSDLATYGGTSRFVEISGVAPDSLDISNGSIADGRFVDESDIAERSHSVIIGDRIARDFFGEEEPIGARMKIGNATFRVVGVMNPGGTRFFSSVDDQIYMPFTTALAQYNQDKLNYIQLKTSFVHLADAQDQIQLELREAHNLDNPEGDLAEDDFRVLTQEDAARNAGMVSSILQILLASIAAISLLVGGIGIMNIMYVSVTERTPEIGLRKALGARHAAVLAQFLAESLLLTLLGGITGILVGISFSWLGIQIISQFQQGWTFEVPWESVALGFGVSAFIGLTFGYFPARRAAHLQPVDALRYE